MTRIFVSIGGSIFLLLGTLHGLLTLKDLFEPKAFTPRDPALREAMQQSSIGLDRSINLWNAWLGFNFTHSLGLMLFGGAFLYLGLFDPAAFKAHTLLQIIGITVSATYLVLSIKFFFIKPTLGSAIGLGSFIVATILARI